MNTGLKAAIIMLLSIALLFGFLHLFLPGFHYNFERLHVFLFNLCCGGTIILYYTEKKKELSFIGLVFLLLSIVYAILAFTMTYIPAMIISLILAGIVEHIRIKRFSAFPVAFFRKIDISEKFHQASLLCLSIGLVISCLVILNNEYLRIISMPKLELDTFFLGFSFPVSLITMSLIFSLMEKSNDRPVLCMKEIGFWSVNLGVIVFFLFIIFEKLLPQVFVTSILFLTVIMIFMLYKKIGRRLQQKNFLTSGMIFLLVTAVTGILYIFFQFTSDYSPDKYKWLLKIHAFAALYGWNLCGLSIICRYDDFPIRLHSNGTILMHWLTVMILAPLGIYYRPFAVLATISYICILYVILFSKGKESQVLI
ncbi:MAG: hypothetical protein R6X10_02830 [Desulfobacterales bacterium]